MIRKLNSILRKTILILGSAVIIYKVIESVKEEQQETNDGFQQKEFDDIW